MIHTLQVQEMPTKDCRMYKPDKVDDDDDDEDYKESLAQMYDTVLASMDRAKYRQRKTSSRILDWGKPQDDEPKKQSDNLSTCTTSSDGTISNRDGASSGETTSGLAAALRFSRDESDGVMKQVQTTPKFGLRGKGRRLGFAVRLWKARSKSDEARVFDNNPRLDTAQPC